MSNSLEMKNAVPIKMTLAGILKAQLCDFNLAGKRSNFVFNMLSIDKVRNVRFCQKGMNTHEQVVH